MTPQVGAIVGTPASQITPHEVFATRPTLLMPTDADCTWPESCLLASNPVVRVQYNHEIPGLGYRATSPLDAADVAGLQSIDCGTDGWCYGYTGAAQLYKTTDTGTTWTQQTSPIVSYYNVVACAAQADCFVVGAPTNTSLEVAVTHDGGSNWSKQSLNGVDALPRAMECASATFCVAVGDRLVVTTRNAGVSWTVEPGLSNGYYSGVSCVTASTCVAVANDRIISTINGGATWTTVLIGATAVACPSATSCMMFGFSSTASAFLFDPTDQSTDDVTIPPGLGRISTLACGSSFCVAVGSASPTFPALSLSQAAVLRGNSIGTSWERATSPPAAAQPLDITCVSGTTCITAGDAGTLSVAHAPEGFIRRTTDGGLTWNPIAVPAPLGEVFLTRCTAVGQCVASGVSTSDPTSSGVMAFSTNAGVSWAIAGVPTDVVAITSIECPAPSICYATATYSGPNAANDVGVMLHTINGGQSWTRSLTFVAGHPAGEVICASASECLATVPNVPFDLTDALWQTTNSGASWQPAAQPSGDLRLRGCFQRRCFVDASGAHFTTTFGPGGPAEWVPTDHLAAEDGPMGCAGTTCIRLQGVYRAYVAATDDWGATWTNALSPLAAHRFSRVDCPDTTVCFAVGLGGSSNGRTVFRFDIGPRPIVSVAPARLLDTRPGQTTIDHLFEGGGLLAADTTVALPIRGRGGVPANVGSAMLNVTITNPLSAGYVTVYPCGEARPNASNVNFVAGATVANSVVSKVGAGDLVCLYTLSSTHLIVDINGYTPGAASSIVPLVPARLLETRSGPGMETIDHLSEGTGPVPANGIVVLPVAGRGGVGDAAGSVLLNVTVTGPAAPGYITVFPCDEPLPNASSVNYLAGSTVANLVISKVALDGTVCLSSFAQTDLIVDVSGYTPVGSSALASIVPSRVLETRVGPGLTTVDHLYEATHPLVADTVFALPVAGRAGIPPDASTVMLNVTVTNPAAAGYVTVYACGQPQPTASNVNYTVGATVANAVVSRVGPISGDVCIYTYASTDLIIDVTGYSL
jgi:photosystem II stability/assembly factor-like uncharacterized protein